MSPEEPPGAERAPQADDASSNASAEERAVAFTTLAEGNHSGVDGFCFAMLHSAEDWRDLWAEHTSDQSALDAAPAVDFGRDMVVALVSGRRPTPGYGLAIERVFLRGERLTIVARETRPDPSRLQAQVLTKPFQFARVPAHDGPVELRILEAE